MGTAYRRNYKNMVGQDDITGHEVLALGVTGLSTVTGPTATPDAFTVSSFTMDRAARLEGLTCHLGGTALASGQLDVVLLVNGSPVGTATMNAASPAGAGLVLKKEDGLEVPLVAGDVVSVTHEVVVALSSAQALSVKVHLAMLE